jgi:hypothetical protein
MAHDHDNREDGVSPRSPMPEFRLAQTTCRGTSMGATFHAHLGHDALPAPLKIRRIEPRDCFVALAEGFDDFLEMPTYPVFVGVFYALAGVMLVSLHRSAMRCTSRFRSPPALRWSGRSSRSVFMR